MWDARWEFSPLHHCHQNHFKAGTLRLNCYIMFLSMRQCAHSVVFQLNFSISTLHYTNHFLWHRTDDSAYIIVLPAADDRNAHVEMWCSQFGFTLVPSLGTPWWRDLGGGGEVASAAADPGRLQVHKEPGCNDLGYRNPQEPQCHRSGHQKEERRPAQTSSVAQQTENRQR